jgi:hypothetical protein
MAAEDLVRSHPFAFKKDSTLGPASITTATSLAVHSAERGGGFCRRFFCRAFGHVAPVGFWCPKAIAADLDRIEPFHGRYRI